ncbi:MAG: hypothetical protein Q8P50_10295 [Bacillota bacterium]|nr:hypothetical protein [Bacillota bacterium]
MSRLGRWRCFRPCFSPGNLCRNRPPSPIGGTIKILFTLSQKSIAGPVTLGGRYPLIIAFGTAFGYTVMSRISLFTGRMQFLLGDWLGLMR